MTTRLPLTIAMPDKTRICQITDYDLDLVYGDNDCSLLLKDCSYRFKGGEYVYINGTACGGTVDATIPDKTSAGISLTYKGRSWAGILKSQIVEPPAGQAHRTVSGSIDSIIGSLISLCGLNNLFAVEHSEGSIESYQINRYIDLYTALRMALSSVGKRLVIKTVEGTPTLSAIPADHYGRATTDRVYFSVEIKHRHINALIGIGKGRGTSRLISRWYADKDGNVSQTQTLFGADMQAVAVEISERYEDVPKKAKELLEEYQKQEAADLKGLEKADLDVGDIVDFFVSETGANETREVTEVVWKVKDGIENVDHVFGAPEWPEDID